VQLTSQVIGPDLRGKLAERAEGQQVADLPPVCAGIGHELARPGWKQIGVEGCVARQDAETQFQEPGRRRDNLFLVDFGQKPADEIGKLFSRQFLPGRREEAFPENVLRPLLAAPEKGPEDAALSSCVGESASGRMQT